MVLNVTEFDEKRMREKATDAAKFYCEEHFITKSVAVECLGYDREFFLNELRYVYRFDIWDVFERTHLAFFKTEVNPILKL